MAPDSEKPSHIPWLPVNEGADPGAPAQPEALTPTKPTVPAWITRERVPEPVEDDEDEELVSPVNAPPPAEVLPSPGSVPTDSEGVPAPPLWGSDPVQLLGESAVTNASLSAAGAPTPLGGVPIATPDAAITPPAFEDQGTAFVPEFAPGPTDPPTPPSPSRADEAAAAILANERASLAAQSESLDAGDAYIPRVAARDDADLGIARTGAMPVVDPDIDTTSTDDEPRRGAFRRLWWLWALIAVLLVAGAATAFALMNRPDPVVIPAAVVTDEPAAPTIEPIAVPDATEFQASMPATVGTYALVEATPLDPADVALTSGRIADGIDLVYRSGDNTIRVRALQYYNAEDTATMFAKFANEPETTTPVEAGGTTVGQMSPVAQPLPGIVWSNGTSLLIATGPPLELAAFYEYFGL